MGLAGDHELDQPRRRDGTEEVHPEETVRPVQRRSKLNREIRRPTDVVGIFTDRDSLIFLVGAMLAEQDDEWIEGRRHLGLDVLVRCRLAVVPRTSPRPRR